MGWSGGTYSRVHNWTADAAVPLNIEAVRMDQEDDSIATGIDTCVTKDGQNTPTANLPMNSNRHTGVGNAQAKTDYASAADVIDQDLLFYVDTGAADAYVITPSPSIGAYEEGQRLVFRATNTNTTTSTLNVNALGALIIHTADGSVLTAGAIISGGYYEVTFDENSTPDRWLLTSPDSVTKAIESRDMIAGTGMTGGGTLAADRTFNVIGGTGITANANDIATDDSAIVHDNLSGFVANEHIDHSGVSVVAGTGLTGGGTIAASRTLNVIGGTGITANANDIATDDAAINHDALLNFVADEHVAHAGVTITAGTGMTGGGTIAATRTLNVIGGAGLVANADDMEVGAGTGITVNADDVALAATAAGTGMTHTAGVLNVIGGDGMTANANDIALTDAAASTTNPVDVSTGVISLDVEALTTIEGSALAATDTFYVEDGGISKGVEVQAMGLQVQLAQGTQTLAAPDMNTIMEFTATSTLTLPINSGVALPVGVPIVLNVKHATQVLTVTAAASVTLVSPNHPAGTAAASDTVNAGGSAVLYKTAADVWALSGDISD